MKFNAKGFKIHSVPNGGQAILDGDNKLVAYRTVANTGNEWQWVRSDYR